jgi:CheY-like chemotaxis protein
MMSSTPCSKAASLVRRSPRRVKAKVGIRVPPCSPERPEDEGHAVVVCLTPLEAMALLHRVSFDLVITDGFSREPGAVFINTADLIRSAGVTPVALFSAHKLDLELARAAGFRDVISKPFDLDTLVRQVKVLLGDLRWCGAPDPPQEGEPWPLAMGSAYSDPAMASRERSFQAAGG